MKKIRFPQELLATLEEANILIADSDKKQNESNNIFVTYTIKDNLECIVEQAKEDIETLIVWSILYSFPSSLYNKIKVEEGDNISKDNYICLDLDILNRFHGDKTTSNLPKILLIPKNTKIYLNPVSIEIESDNYKVETYIEIVNNEQSLTYTI